jgi:uncharacterized protein YdcH (DUF465 family)
MQSEEVMKALECWVSKKPCEEDCPILEYEGSHNCIALTMKNALSLLREKDAYIARLTEDNERLHASCTKLERNRASLNDDNERLRAELSSRPPRLLITRKP